MLPWKYAPPPPPTPSRHEYDDPGDDHPRMTDGTVPTPSGEAVRVRTHR